MINTVYETAYRYTFTNKKKCWFVELFNCRGHLIPETDSRIIADGHKQIALCNTSVNIPSVHISRSTADQTDKIKNFKVFSKLHFQFFDFFYKLLGRLGQRTTNVKFQFTHESSLTYYTK